MLKRIGLGVVFAAVLSVGCAGVAEGGDPLAVGGTAGTAGAASAEGGTVSAEGGTVSAEGGTVSAEGGTASAEGGTASAEGGKGGSEQPIQCDAGCPATTEIRFENPLDADETGTFVVCRDTMSGAEVECVEGVATGPYNVVFPAKSDAQLNGDTFYWFGTVANEGLSHHTLTLERGGTKTVLVDTYIEFKQSQVCGLTCIGGSVDRRGRTGEGSTGVGGATGFAGAAP